MSVYGMDATAIRDAVLSEIPQDAHGSKEAFDIAYETGQAARVARMRPEDAADLARQRFADRSVDCVRGSRALEHLVPTATWL